MKELDISLEILGEVLDEKITFSEALRKKFQTHVELRPLRSDVAGIVGCELRHHLLFSYLLKEQAWEEGEKRLAALALANAYFFRRLNAEQLEADVKERLGEEKFAALETLLSLRDHPESFIPASISRSSNLYLSLRYNAPEWVLKIFEHFGYGATYKTLKKFAHPAKNILRVATSSIAMNTVLESPEFTANAAYPSEMVDYHGKTSLRKNEAFKSGFLFEEKPFAHSLLLSHRVEAPKQILLYDGNPSSALERDLIEIYGADLGLNIAVDDFDSRPEVLRMIRDRDLHNVNFFDAPQGNTLGSAVATMQDLVIVAPNSTNFDDIPSAPDFLLRFNKEGMDEIIANQAKALRNAAQFVEEDGTLLYVVFTISKKEGHQAVAEFLRENDAFKLVSEKQHFPFEAEGCAAYVAEMVKGQKAATIDAPLQGLKELEAEQARASSAKAK